jgi:hypothetical protein
MTWQYNMTKSPEKRLPKYGKKAKIGKTVASKPKTPYAKLYFT